MTDLDLSKNTVEELRALAEAEGVEVDGRWGKDRVIEALNDHFAASPDEEPEVGEEAEPEPEAEAEADESDGDETPAGEEAEAEPDEDVDEEEPAPEGPPPIDYQPYAGTRIGPDGKRHNI